LVYVLGYCLAILAKRTFYRIFLGSSEQNQNRFNVSFEFVWPLIYFSRYAPQLALDELELAYLLLLYAVRRKSLSVCIIVFMDNVHVSHDNLSVSSSYIYYYHFSI